MDYGWFSLMCIYEILIILDHSSFSFGDGESECDLTKSSIGLFLQQGSSFC